MQYFLIHYIRTHIGACSGSLKLATDIEFPHIFIYANKADTDGIRNSEMSRSELQRAAMTEKPSMKLYSSPTIVRLSAS